MSSRARPEFLKPYTTARPQLRKAKGDLFLATSDEPNQRRQARQINRLIDEYIAVYVDNVPVIGQENLGAARDASP